MPRYQCYLLTPDLHVARGKNFKAANDLEALRKSRHILDGQRLYRAFELWHRDHRIGSDLDEAAEPSTLPANCTRA